MREPLRRSAAAAGLAAVLAGCAALPGQTIVTRERQVSTYSPQVVNYTAGKGGLYVEVVPGRLAGDPQRFERRTLAALRRSRVGNLVALTPDPAVGEATSTRLVVLFDPGAVEAYDVCAGAREQSAAGTPGRVMMTFCQGQKPITTVRARNTAVRAADGAAFSDMLQAASAALFPPKRLDRGDGADFGT
jgi:hypothetical protein